MSDAHPSPDAILAARKIRFLRLNKNLDTTQTQNSLILNLSPADQAWVLARLKQWETK